MLVQHREVVHELFHHGHINDRESEGLIAENNAARVKLEYHPAADQIPDRCENLVTASVLNRKSYIQSRRDVPVGGVHTTVQGEGDGLKPLQ